MWKSIWHEDGAVLYNKWDPKRSHYHNKCELLRINRFDAPYSNEARTKLIITHPDRKPDDVDGYRGAYGAQDTREALIEAKHQGNHPFYLTTDETTRNDLPPMHGDVNNTIIDTVAKRLLKVADIYRRSSTRAKVRISCQITVM